MIKLKFTNTSEILRIYISRTPYPVKTSIGESTTKKPVQNIITTQIIRLKYYFRQPNFSFRLFFFFFLTSTLKRNSYDFLSTSRAQTDREKTQYRLHQTYDINMIKENPVLYILFFFSPVEKYLI